MTQARSTGAFRRAALERMALATGEQWALSYRAEVRESGRAIAGGWPGTLSEARARVAGACSRTASKQRWTNVTPAELDWLAKAAYAMAKRRWLAVAARDEP